MGDLVVGVISNIAFWALCIAIRKFRNWSQRRRRAVRPVLLGVVLLVFIGTNLASYYYSPRYFIVLFLVSTCGIGFLFWTELYQFWRVGLMGADKTIAVGLGFKESLDLCTNSLEFMGVGAAKLTAQGKIFENAVARCNRVNKPIRFLLCDPNSDQLVKIARQANRPEKEYQESTRKSLRVLAELKINREWNIEVRFYKDLPLFRLMFIDDVLCLASHYVFGEGDGSQLPQLHVRRPTSHQRDVESLYHPFRTYFESVWKESVPWDFNTGDNP